uniref:Uncharacterized protein n=1 Tax=uncultured marine virus TaxID=186617 RepID=A0A0F7LB21_9VIRU|nr:hypothetical protein [uncultured marine virus]
MSFLSPLYCFLFSAFETHTRLYSSINSSVLELYFSITLFMALILLSCHVVLFERIYIISISPFCYKC